MNASGSAVISYVHTEAVVTLIQSLSWDLVSLDVQDVREQPPFGRYKE